MASQVSNSTAIEFLSIEDLRLEYERREFALLSLISSLQREVYNTQKLVGEWETNNIKEDAQLRSVIVDPSVNLEIKELRQKLFEKDQIIKNITEDLQAQNFNPQHVTGSRLISKCKLLYEENNELGRFFTENQLQPLNILLMNQKKYINALKFEIKQLRELNLDIDQDNDSLTNQLTDLTKNIMVLKEEKNKLKLDLESAEDLITKLKSNINYSEQNTVNTQETSTSYNKEITPPDSSNIEGHTSSRPSKRSKLDKEKHSHSDRGREKDREGRKGRDRSRDRDRYHKESHRDRDRRKEKGKSEKDREKVVKGGSTEF